MAAVVDVKDVIASAKALLSQQPKKMQNAFDFNAPNVAAAKVMLTDLLPTRPKVKEFWLTLADAQMMQGKLMECKDSLARALSIMCPQGHAVHGKRKNKVSSGALDPFSALGAPYTRLNFDKVLTSYKKVASKGMHDRRLRFYIFNLLKAVDDLPSACAWLDSEDLDDAFLAHYCREYHKCDYFNYQIRAWFQKRLFTRISTASPPDFEVLYFSCLLHDAAENEAEALAEMENEPEAEDDAWTDEDAIIFEINKETQMWTMMRATVLRVHGKLGAAQAELDKAINSGHSLMVSLAAKLESAHIKLEQLQVHEAFDIYNQLRTDARVAADGLILSQSELLQFRPITIEADACAGAAQCLHLLGREVDAQALFSIALQTDSLCGEAGVQRVLYDCKRLALSTGKATLELLARDMRQSDSSQIDIDLDEIVSSGPRCRFVPMATDLLHPSEALIQRSKLVKNKGDEWKEKLQELADSGDTDRIWICLFALIAEQRFSDADATLSVLMGFRPPVALPTVLDVDAYMEKFCIKRDISGATTDPGQRALISKFYISRGNWFEKKLAMYTEAFAEFAVALDLLDKGLAEHRTLLSKLLWKRHKIFLRKECAEAAVFNLKECVIIATQDFNLSAQADDAHQQFLNRKCAKYIFFLGTLYYGLDRTEEAIPLFAKSMKIDKYLAASKGWQGLCYARLGPAKHSDAIHMLRESLLYGEDSLRDKRVIRMTLAALLSHSGPLQNYSGAIEQYRILLEFEHEDSEVLFLRGEVYLVSDQLQPAIVDFSKCIDMLNRGESSATKLNRALYSRARAFQRLGDYHHAILNFESVQGPEKNSIELMSNLVSVYEATGEVEKALSTYEKLIKTMDKSDEKHYASILHRRAAICSVCNQQAQALIDLEILIKLDLDDVKARHQRGSTLCAKYSHAAKSTSKEEREEALAFLRMALEDFQLVLKLKPGHVQAKLRRRDVCNILNVTLPNDDGFDYEMKLIETEHIDNLRDVEPALVIDYALRMALDIQADLKGAGHRIFPLLRLRGGKTNAQTLSSWEELNLTIFSDGRCAIKDDIFFFKSSTCTREEFGNGLFSFRMCFTDSNRAAVVTLASSSSRERDIVFRYWHRFKVPAANPTELYSTPIRLLEKLHSLNSKVMEPLFHVAKLREQQLQFAMARAMHMIVLQGLSAKQADHTAHAETKHDKTSHPTSQNRPNTDKVKFVRPDDTWNGKMTPPTSSLVKGITEAMCRIVPGNVSMNQLKGEIFYRLAIMTLEDPSITDSENSKLEVAVWYLRISLRIDGNQKDTQFKLGTLLLRIDDFEDALTCFRSVTRLAPECAEAWNNMGVAADRAGQSDESVYAFGEAIRLKSDFQYAACNLCLIKLRAALSSPPNPTELTKLIGDLSKAIDNCDSAHPSQVLAYGLRGLAYQLRNSTKKGFKDVDLAIQDYLTAIDRDASNVQGRIGIICIYLNRQNLGDAYPYMEWLVASHPRSDIVGELLVWCRKVRLVFEEPISNFLECIRMNPNFRSLSLVSANVNIEPLKSKEETLNVLLYEARKASETDSNVNIHLCKDGPRMSAYHCLRMACLCEEEGDTKRGLALATQAIALLPAQGDAIIRAHVWRSLAFEKQGKLGQLCCCFLLIFCVVKSCTF